MATSVLRNLTAVMQSRKLSLEDSTVLDSVQRTEDEQEILYACFYQSEHAGSWVCVCVGMMENWTETQTELI